jgi:Arc/MetJ family transcription regulator
MRTNFVLDEKLVKEALELSGIKTKKELIHKALLEFVKNKKRKNLLDLCGKIEFKKDYDYQSMRN